MVNFTQVDTLITEAFGLLSTLIGEVVTLLTGDLFVLAVVAGVVALIVGLISFFYKWIKDAIQGSTPKMRK